MASLTRSGPATTLRTALRQPNRAYAVPSFAPASASPFAVFDRQLKRAQRDRAARNVERSRLTDYVKDDVAQGMVDRLLVRLVSSQNDMQSLGSGSSFAALPMVPSKFSRRY